MSFLVLRYTTRMSDGDCQKLLHIFAAVNGSLSRFCRSVFARCRPLPHLRQLIKEAPGTDVVQEACSGSCVKTCSGWDVRGSQAAAADLRSWEAALRLAMNAARRLPRAHGMTVVSVAAVSTMLLMKRLLVFMVVSSVFRVRACALLEDQYAAPLGPTFDPLG